jgi:hypothetical protein
MKGKINWNLRRSLTSFCVRLSHTERVTNSLIMCCIKQSQDDERIETQDSKAKSLSSTKGKCFLKNETIIAKQINKKIKIRFFSCSRAYSP